MAWFQGSLSSNVQDISTTPPPPTDAEKQAYFDYIRQVNPAEYEQQKYNDPKWVAEQQAQSLQEASAGSTPTTVAPVAAPQVDLPQPLNQLNALLGSDFASRYLPDTLDDPFVSSAVGAQRGKADQFIQNMLKRGTLTEAGRGGATKVLDDQTAGVTSKLNQLSSALLGADRNRLTDFANTKRNEVAGIPPSASFDPTPYVNQVAQTGQGYASTFGSRFNETLPAGDLFDTSGIAGAGGGVSSPQNVLFDPYAQEGGQLKTGLEDQGESVASDRKRRTTVF